MKKILTVSLIVSFLALSVAVVFAQPQQRMNRARRTFDRPQNRILGVLKANQEDLGITEEQIEQIQDLVFSFKEKSLKMQNESSLSRLELQKLMQNRYNLDYDKIKAILSKTSAVRNEMFIQGLKLREEINNILTPEQREALKEMGRKGMRSRTRDLRDRFQQRFPRSRSRIRR
jgi:Spy/CpxP family protein refolding chaperone